MERPQSNFFNASQRASEVYILNVIAVMSQTFELRVNGTPESYLLFLSLELANGHCHQGPERLGD